MGNEVYNYCLLVLGVIAVSFFVNTTLEEQYESRDAQNVVLLYSTIFRTREEEH